MRAMILAAGLGKRMGALTQDRPKPLLKVAGRYLIEYSIHALLKAGIRDIVINLHYHKEQVKEALGDGQRYGAKFYYSEEEELLETGGGIIKALPLLGDEPFLVLSSDLISDYPLQRLLNCPLKMGHLVMVDNPSYRSQGDYCLNEKGELYQGEGKTYTFANIALLRPELFKDQALAYRRLADIWKEALQQGQLTGESYQGLWYNVGTPQDLEIAASSPALLSV